MKKQKRKGLALFLAFVMLVSLVYVPGTTFTTFAENIQQSPPPAEIQPPADIIESSNLTTSEIEVEDPLTEEERQLKALRDQLNEETPQCPVKEGKFAAFSVADVSDDKLHLTPAGGKFFKGENFKVRIRNHEQWPFFLTGYDWGLSTTAGRWTDVLYCDFFTADRYHVYDVDRNIAIQAYGDDDVPPYTNNSVDVQIYEFIDPPSIESLSLQSRSNESVTVEWGAPSSQTPFQYTLWIPSTTAEEWEKIGTVPADEKTEYTVDGLDAGQSIDIAVRAEYKGHVNEEEAYFSEMTKGTFKVADFKVTTRIQPDKAGSVAPKVSYYDRGETMIATAELTEGYEVKEWKIKELSENTVAKVLGFGESEIIEVSAAAPADEDEPAETDTHEFVVDSDLLITARAGLKVFTVEVISDNAEAGSVHATIKSGKPLKKLNRYQYGTVLNLIAEPQKGYILESWQEDKNGSQSTTATPYRVTDSACITGMFVKEPVGFVEDQLTIRELNDGAPIAFSRQDRSLSGFEIAGAPADDELVAEVNQEVPYGTTLKELLYHVELNANPNNNVMIKDGARFVDLSSLALNQKGTLYDAVDFEVYNTSTMMLLHGNNALEAPLADGVALRLKFKLHHDEDSRFNSATSATELNGAPYTNDVVIYTLNVKIDVLDPLLKLNVQTGGTVGIEATKGPQLAEDVLDVAAMFETEITGPKDFSRFFKENRWVKLTAAPKNLADYKFDGWYYVDDPDELYDSASDITIPMNQNWDLIAKFSKVEYAIVENPEMKNGKILYMIVGNQKKAPKKFSGTKLPVTTLHYGDTVQLKAEPNLTWLFHEWLKPNRSRNDVSATNVENAMRNGQIITITIKGKQTLEMFGEARKLDVEAAFMPDYGFESYMIKDIEGNADLLQQIDDREGLLSFDYIVPIATSVDKAMETANFEVFSEVINAENNEIEWRPNPLSDKPSVPMVIEKVAPHHFMTAGPISTPFYGVDERTFAYDVRVNQYRNQYDEEEVMALGRTKSDAWSRTEILDINRKDDAHRTYSKYYTFRVNLVEKPQLTVEIPLGGSVNLSSGSPVDTEPAEAINAASETLTTGVATRFFEKGQAITVTALASEGYSFSGWTVSEGYTSPVNPMVMEGNYKVKPIFTAIQTDRKRNRNNNNTPQQQIEQILDETTPLGTLYRQLFIGYPNGDLRMFDSISRAQLSLILQRAQQYDVSNPPVIPVTDVMEEWYRNEALTALGKGYINLRPGNIFAGHDAVTGAELLAALNKAFGANLTLEQAYQLANGVSTDQVEKIMAISTTDFQLAMSGAVPLGVDSFDANKPVSRELVARMIYAVLYPQVPATTVTPQ